MSETQRKKKVWKDTERKTKHGLCPLRTLGDGAQGDRKTGKEEELMGKEQVREME
jgi:hypothetical protein